MIFFWSWFIFVNLTWLVGMSDVSPATTMEMFWKKKFPDASKKNKSSFHWDRWKIWVRHVCWRPGWNWKQNQSREKSHRVLRKFQNNRSNSMNSSTDKWTQRDLTKGKWSNWWESIDWRIRRSTKHVENSSFLHQKEKSCETKQKMSNSNKRKTRSPIVNQSNRKNSTVSWNRIRMALSLRIFFRLLFQWWSTLFRRIDNSKFEWWFHAERKKTKRWKLFSLIYQLKNDPSTMWNKQNIKKFLFDFQRIPSIKRVNRIEKFVLIIGNVWIFQNDQIIV